MISAESHPLAYLARADKDRLGKARLAQANYVP
jgi:hypothetical protein